MRFKNTPYRIVPLARCVLAKLYIEHVNDSDKEMYSETEILNIFSVPISKNLLRSSLEFMRTNYYGGKSLIRRHGNQESGHRYSVTPEGLREVERSSRDKSSDISYFIENGDESLDEIAGPSAIFWTRDEYQEVSAWKPIEVDLDDETYRSALEETEKALEEIQKNNELEAKYPLEKAGIVDSLKIGIERLKSLRPTRAQLNDLIVKPLKWISSTFANTFLGQVAKTAAQKVVDFVLSVLF